MESQGACLMCVVGGRSTTMTFNDCTFKCTACFLWVKRLIEQVCKFECWYHSS